jgi:WD40 repeat protein
LALALLALAATVTQAGAQSIYTPYAFTNFASLPGVTGTNDGAGRAARFSRPYAVAVDSADNVYVADEMNEAIRKITPAGVVTTLAGAAGQTGDSDGTGSAARFNNPYGVAVDSGGNVYVADTFNHTIRKIAPAGVVTTLAGSAGKNGSADGTGSGARFFQPSGVAVDSADNVYVADAENYTIRKITPAGVVTTLAGGAGPDYRDGTGGAARLGFPVSVAVDSAGNVYVASVRGYSMIRKITPAGGVTTLAGMAWQVGIGSGTGSADGIGRAARFNDPYGVAVDSGGNLYVADTENHRITKGSPTKWDAAELAKAMLLPPVPEVPPLATPTVKAAQAAQDVSARLWEASTGKLIRTFEGHNRPVTAIAFSPDGSKILTGSITDELRLWDTATGKQIQRFHIGPGREVTALVFSADGQRFLVGGGYSRMLELRDATTGEVIQTFKAQRGVSAALFVSDGQKVLAAGSSDTTITEWETATGKQTRIFMEKSWQGVNRVTLTADGRTRSWWNSSTGGSVPGEFQVPAQQLGQSFQDNVAISPDAKKAFTWSGSLGLSATHEGRVLVAHWARLWDLEAGKVIWFSQEFPGQRAQFAFSPDGAQFLTGSHEGGARLWDATTGAAIRTLGTQKQSFQWLAFSPNGKTILAWGADKVMRLWDAQTGKRIQSFSVPVVTCVVFSPDETRILTGGKGEWAGE